MFGEQYFKDRLTGIYEFSLISYLSKFRILQASEIAGSRLKKNRFTPDIW